MVPSVSGHVLNCQLRTCLITSEKLASEMRSKGYASWHNVYAVVLEPMGRFSVITKGR